MPGITDTVPVLITRRVPVPAEDVIARLGSDPAACLGASAGEAGPAARHFVPLDVRFAGVRFDRVAAVGFGTLVEEDDGTPALPVWWEAAEQPWLFPTFAGGLEVRSIASGAELRLEGRYRPPLGTLGALVDRTVLNRAATGSLEAFLDRLAASLGNDRAN